MKEITLFALRLAPSVTTMTKKDFFWDVLDKKVKYVFQESELKNTYMVKLKIEMQMLLEKRTKNETELNFIVDEQK